MSARDASKRVPKSLDTGTHIIGRYTLTDIAVGSLPGVVVILLIQLMIPPGLTVAGYRLAGATLPLTAIALAVGALVVYLTPAHLTTIQWIALIIGFRSRTTDLPYAEALEHTHVLEIHPDSGVVERTDGAFVGFVQVIPPPMALATDDEWAHKADGFQEFLNTTVDFPIQLYSTTQPFPVDEYLAQYESRRTDPDVRANRQLATLIDEYVQWYRAELAQRRMTIRDHYVVVSVRPDEVRFERESLAQKLTVVPILGVFIKAVLAPQQDIERAAMFDAIADRLQAVERGLREIDGCDARRVGAVTAAELLASFWHGEKVRYEDPNRVVSRRLLIGGDS
jgi:hypothetical protein